MIFELDNSLVSFAEKNQSNANSVILVLELLSVALREGNHLIFAEMDVAERLLAIIAKPDSSAGSLLLKLINQYPKIASLAYEIKLKAIIGDFKAIIIQDCVGGQLIRYPLSLVNSGLLQKSILLVENINDAEFYRLVTSAVLKDTRFKSVTLALEGYQGGGNTTAEAYDNLKQETSRLCLCIVDSDVRAPLLGPGETAKKVIKSDRLAPVARAKSHVIGACSIENLIPFSFFEKVWGEDPNYSFKLQAYKTHYRENHWRYLQLKKNISCFELYGATAFSVYWADQLAHVSTGCVEDQPSCDRKSSCQAYKLPLLSGSPLGSTIKLIKNQGFANVQLLPDIREAWENIAYEVLSWCCAPSQSAAA